MFTLDLIINPLVVLAALIGGAILGFSLGKGKLARKQSRIVELETEMMSSHAEVLELQKAYMQLERKLGDQSSPVISMKIKEKDAPKEKISK